MEPVVVIGILTFEPIVILEASKGFNTTNRTVTELYTDGASRYSNSEVPQYVPT